MFLLFEEGSRDIKRGQNWTGHCTKGVCTVRTSHRLTGWQLASKQLARTVHTTYVVHTHSCIQSKDSIVLKSPPQAPASKQETRKQATLASKQRNTVVLKVGMCGWWFVEVVCCPAWPQTSLLTGCTVLVLVRLCWQAGDVRTVHTPYVQ